MWYKLINLAEKFLSFQHHVSTISHRHNCHSSIRLYIHSHASKVFWYITVTWMEYYSSTCFNRPISCCKLITIYLYLQVVNLDFTLLHIFLSLYQILQVLRIYYQLLPDWVSIFPTPPPFWGQYKEVWPHLLRDESLGIPRINLGRTFKYVI